MTKSDQPPPELGALPPDYVNEDAVIAAEQGPQSFFMGCTALLTTMFRLFVPNRWPK